MIWRVQSKNKQGRMDNCPQVKTWMGKYIFTDLEGLVSFLVITYQIINSSGLEPFYSSCSMGGSQESYHYYSYSQ